MRKILFLGLGLLAVAGLSGCATTGMPGVVVHKYDYQAKPPAGQAPGAPPSPPSSQPAAVDYQTIYGSAFDDPSLVIFKNDSYRKVKIDIGGQKKPIVLEPYGATTNLYLGLGSHSVRVIIEKPTAVHGTWRVVQFFTIYIRPEGKAQIFHIRDSSSEYYGYFW